MCLPGGILGRVLVGCDPRHRFRGGIGRDCCLGRVEKKYHSLALRICLLDAGAVVSQLRNAADAFGFQVTLVEHWDDEKLAKQFGDNGVHPVMAVIGIRGLNGVGRGQ